MLLPGMMRKSWLIIIMVTFTCGTLFGADSVPFATGEWEPLIGKRLPESGPLVKVVRAACNAAGLPYTIEFYPWARAENMVEHGNVFAAFPYAITPERKKKFNYSSIPVCETRVVIYYMEGHGKDIQWKDFSDFRGASFASVSGYWYVDSLSRSGVTTEFVVGDSAAFRMLGAGRVDYVMVDEPIGDEIVLDIFKSNSSTIKKMTRPVLTRPLYLLVSRGYPNSASIVKKFDAGMRIIKADGTYERALGVKKATTTNK